VVDATMGISRMSQPTGLEPPASCSLSSSVSPKPAPELPAGLRGKVVDVTMEPGSVIVFLGTLVHRGGANRSDRPRLALSNQYCEPWARPQENYFLSIPPEKATRTDCMSEITRRSVLSLPLRDSGIMNF